MVSYRVKTPAWLKRLFPKELVWDMPVTDTPTVYLTFDDGPHPVATPFVLDTLAQYGATATFFCIGKNVVTHPEIYQRALREGHTTGNHTYQHVNGWKTKNARYIANIKQATGVIHSRLFRPPYGRIKHSQVRKLRQADARWKVYMWDVLSADFDTNISPQQCLDNVLAHIAPGAIVVFHDSEKAWPRMSYTLPHVLEFCKQNNWLVKALPRNP